MTGAATTRELAFAQTALRQNFDELCAKQPGSGRNDTLNSVAFRMGRMVGAGWIERETVEETLIEGSRRNGYEAKRNVAAVKATIASGLGKGIQDPHPPLSDAPVDGALGESLSQFVKDGWEQRFAHLRRPVGWSGQLPPTGRWPQPTPISLHEWTQARLTPKTILERFIYSDVGTLVAAGGTGKTTFMLWLACYVVLGIDFAGRKVEGPGRVVFLTAEDSREILVARLRRIAAANFEHQSFKDFEKTLARIRDGIVIIDVSSDALRLMKIENDVVRVDTANVDDLVNILKPLQSSLLVVDTLVSFGVGESRVNNAAQGLIEAGRRINRALDCGVIYVQHSGKQNARDKAVDQYAGRSGSAMPDDSRLVAVMNPVTPEDWQKTTGQAVADGATGLLVTLPKLSYAPQQAPLYFERNGYAFRHVSCEKLTPDMEAAVHDARVLEFLKDGAAKGSSYSKQMLESIGVEGLNRNEVRAALARLEAANRIKPGKGPGARIQVLDTRPPMGSHPQNLPTTFPSSNVGHWIGFSR